MLRSRALRLRPSPSVGATLAVLVFVAITVWWLTQDSRVPEADSAMHMDFALDYRAGFSHGDFWRWFDSFTIYPPLGHLLGALAAVIAGTSVSTFVMAQNVVFVPLLALGCYGTGTVVYNRTVGMLSAIFALAAPIFVSQFHAFLLDAPLAALVSVTVWLLLASRRFERTGVAALAGVALGLAAMTKVTAASFCVGLVALLLLRGGWRQWRGWLAFGVAAAVVAGPWLIAHLGDEAVFGTSFAVSGVSQYAATNPAPLSPADFAWYFWAYANFELYTPFTVLAIVGVVVAGVRAWRRRGDGEDLAPELLGGFLVALVLTVAIRHNDPRYAMPLIVFVAVFATATVGASARPALRRIGAAAIVTLAAVNLSMVAFGWGSTAFTRFAGAPPDSVVEDHTLTWLSPGGFNEGAPRDSAGVLRAFRAVHRAGGRRIALEGRSSVTTFQEYNGAGATFLAERLAGLHVVPLESLAPLGRRDAFAFRREVRPGMPAPCVRFSNGTGLYFVAGEDLDAKRPVRRAWCPGGSPEFASGDPFVSQPLVQTPAERTDSERLEAILAAARRAGLRSVAFHSSVAADPALLNAQGLIALSQAAGLPLHRGPYATLSRTDLFALRRIPGRGLPQPCLRLVDGSAIWFVRGRLTVPLERARNLVCPRVSAAGRPGAGGPRARAVRRRA